LTLSLGTQNDPISRNFKHRGESPRQGSANPEAKAEAQAKLMEMAQQGELAQLEAQVKEMQSARDREVQIATSASLHPRLIR
jgi:hypothetical protein